MRSSSAPKTLPSSSRRARTQSTLKTEANATEATMGGVKRAPSSLVAQASPRGGPGAAQHRDEPVVRAARDLRVEMAADQHRRQMVVAAGPAGEDVAHPIDGDRAARLRAPGDEEVAHLLVGIGEGQTPEPAGLARPDLARAHDGAPEPAGIDRDRRVVCAHGPHHASARAHGTPRPRRASWATIRS